MQLQEAVYGTRFAKRRCFYMVVLASTLVLAFVVYSKTTIGPSPIIIKYQEFLKGNQIPQKKFEFLTPNQTNESFDWCPGTPKSTLDCEALFNGQNEAISKSINWTPPCTYSDSDIADRATNCDSFKKQFQFPTSAFSEEEMDFPLAFVFVVEKEAEQVIRLLSTMYQPQNAYCLTYDTHASDIFKKAMDKSVGCFPENVWSPRLKREIFWGDMSILDATFDCLKVLSDRYNQIGWRYVQIISWNDVPLKTNLEMVKILKLHNGANDVELIKADPSRFRHHHFQGADVMSLGSRPMPPNGVEIFKGSYAVTLSQEFVNFLLTDATAKLIYEYCRDMWGPEEQFWATVAHNIHLKQPGAYPGSCLEFYQMEKKKKDWISRYQSWDFLGDPCKGMFTRNSCVFGVGDLTRLKNEFALVAHKFYRTYQPAAYYCLHQRLFQRSRRGYTDLQMGYYKDLPAVRYQAMSDKNQFKC